MLIDYFAQTIGSDDRAAVFYQQSDILIAVVADGAGGTRFASEAADDLIKLVQQNILTEANLMDETYCCRVLAQVDAWLHPRAGETTGVIAVINTKNNSIVVACVGDSEAYLLSNKSWLNLTEHQYRKPLLGSGAAIPIAYGPITFDGTLILGSDGLFKYADFSQIIESYQPKESILRLFELVRLPSGRFIDDISIIIAQPK
ncbi:hypothetical protein PN36_19605 [Candidatus Thiomargarita nelsonii]|uniref:PPM-type phosphatase domain-containing protein n=1 Tax=Candidatus Thiomargarita nelsonii TaxID=1003181 RepID=A0A4E0RRE1_9GAMM|nr:hypothetical protein PN36_19605 [Candidatus Thiomargarita nelsonii]